MIVAGDRCYAIDLNPRIGGGYPFSHLSGANVPAALVAWTRGETPDALWLRVEPGVAASRGETFIFTQRPDSSARDFDVALKEKC
jgi:carbamoyl-phosphate synthase large subunit